MFIKQIDNCSICHPNIMIGSAGKTLIMVIGLYKLWKVFKS